MRNFNKKPVKTFRKSFKKYRTYRKVSQEFKRIDSTNATAISTTATYTLLNGVAQGNEYNQRIGRKIMMRKIMCRGYVKNEDATPTETRIMIVYDKASNGVAPVLSDIVDGNEYNGFRNIDNVKRFQVLMDKRLVLQPSAADSVKPFNFYKNVFLQTRHDGTTAGIGDITTGSLYLITVSNDASTGATLNCDWRVSYTD